MNNFKIHQDPFFQRDWFEMKKLYRKILKQFYKNQTSTLIYLWDQLENALDLLSDKQRDILELRYRDGKRVVDISKSYQVSSSSISATINKSFKILATELFPVMQREYMTLIRHLD